MTKAYDYDLFVIGAGSGGVRAARLAGAMGLKVGIAEEDRPGGTCVLRGCVPKKLMVYASQGLELCHSAQGFGWDVKHEGFDWERFRSRLHGELDRLSAAYTNTLKSNSVQSHHGRGRLKGGHEVVIDHPDGTQSKLTSQTILLAVGGWPSLPDVPGAPDHGLTSNDMFQLKALPNSIMVVGGGYIAVEFAGIMNGLGVKTTLCYRGEQILRGFDHQVRDHVCSAMTARGITILTNANPTSLTQADKGICAAMDNGPDVTIDKVLFATGRHPKTKNLGLEAAGIACDQVGAIVVDEYSMTSQAHIYAIGDVTNRVNLTPVAIREAVAFIDTVYKGHKTAYNHHLIPTAVFSQPEIGTVGLSEGEAIENGLKIKVYETQFRPMKTAFLGDQEKNFMKLIVEENTDILLGAHMVGNGAGEIMQMGAIAIKMGITKSQWDSTCAVHPTTAEEFVTMKVSRGPIGA